MEHLRFKSEQTAAAYVADELLPAEREAFELHMMSCPECVDDVESWRTIKNHLPEEVPDLAMRGGTGHQNEPSAAHRELDDQASAVERRGVAREPVAPNPPRDARKGRATRPRSAADRTDNRSGHASGGTSRPPGRTGAGRWRLTSAVAASLLAGTIGGWYVRSAHGPSIEGEHIGFYSLPPLSRGPENCMALRLRPAVSLLVLRIPGAVPDQQLVPVNSEGHDLPSGSYSVQVQGDGSWLVRLPASAVRQQGIRFEARSLDGTADPRGCVISAAQQ